MDKNVVKAASRECKAAIDALEIVTPAIYTSIFTEIAKKYGIETEVLASASEDFLDSKISQLLILNEKSGEQIETLDKTSKKALNAMRTP